MDTIQFEIFLVTVPGMESALCEEATARGFPACEVVSGGVSFQGDWSDVWRANLQLRGATRVLARIGSFRAFHLAQLDKRARKFLWGDTLREEAGITIDAEAAIVLKVRIDDNLCTFSLDTSGAPLHIRGHKEAINKAPMRENLAALFLHHCGYDGTEPVVDPMCGSGTFVIEAAEIAAGLAPGRTRTFAFEDLASFDAAAWEAMKAAQHIKAPAQRFYGSDRDAGAIRMSQANATRAGVVDYCDFATHAISDLVPPEGPKGLVIVNPPYGGRIGNKKLLFAVYGALGKTLLNGFKGWRVGIVTSEPGLAKATGLPFKPNPIKVSHGGMGVALYQTPSLK